jgi:hypothetical protein
MPATTLETGEVVTTVGPDGDEYTAVRVVLFIPASLLSEVGREALAAQLGEATVAEVERVLGEVGP